MSTLELIQHVFDYLLEACTSRLLSCRHGKQLREGNDGDEDMGMAHSVLSALPPIVDYIPDEGYEEVEAKQEEVEVPIPDGDVLPRQEEALEEYDDTPPSPSSPSHLAISTTPRLPPFSFTAITSLETSTSTTSLLNSIASTRRQTLQGMPTYPSRARNRPNHGPKSVPYTWSRDFTLLPSVKECKKIVGMQEEVVLRFIEEPASGEDDDEDELDLISETPTKRERNRLKKPRRHWYISHRRQAVGTTTVLVLGVALAVYGSREGRAVGERAGMEEGVGVGSLVSFLVLDAGGKGGRDS